MEIEIVTTKRKLSKSIINQMRRASKQVLIEGTTLGYLISVRKGSYKDILIKHGDEFFLIPANYTKGEKSIYRQVDRGSISRRFESKAACDSWWRFYQARMREAVNQIYV